MTIARLAFSHFDRNAFRGILLRNDIVTELGDGAGDRADLVGTPCSVECRGGIAARQAHGISYQFDHRFDDSEAANQEARRQSEQHADHRCDDQQPRGCDIFLRCGLCVEIHTIEQAVRDGAHRGPHLLRGLAALHGGFAQPIGLLVEMHIGGGAGELDGGLQVGLVCCECFVHGRQHGARLLVAGFLDAGDAGLQRFQLRFDVLFGLRDVLRPGIQRKTEFGAIEPDDFLVRAGARQGALR